MTGTLRVFLIALAALALLPLPARSQGWLAALSSHASGPSRFLAVDKSAQTFMILEQKSPLRVAYKTPCATGQVLGDKSKEGDLRTPEGVYFVTSKLDSGLDFDMYGDLAFPLNFPNPVDKLKGKSGHGIWIHGRGAPIMPYETKGCVALNNPVIHDVASDIEMSMPVIIAGDITWTDAANQTSAEADEVIAATRDWAKAWQEKSGAFFDFHDPAKFSIAQGESFKSFRQHKERLFKQLPWIVVALEDVRALPGPDYWVTYFTQFYRSPTLISQGVKRLYWQKDDAGAWKIVGMEFEQTEPTLAAKYPGGKAVMLADASKPAASEEAEANTPKPDAVSEEEPARKSEPSVQSADITALLEAWRTAWEKARIDDYMAFYAKDAAQGDRVGKDSIRDQKKTLWSERPPVRVKLKDVRMRPRDGKYVVEFVQVYESAGGYGDKGLKELVLAQEQGGWRIVKESWSRL